MSELHIDCACPYLPERATAVSYREATPDCHWLSGVGEEEDRYSVRLTPGSRVIS